MTLYAEKVMDQTDNFANAFVRKNVGYGYDVVMTLSCSRVGGRRQFLFTDIQFKKSNILIVYSVPSANLVEIR